MSRPPKLSIQISAFTLIRATINTPNRMIYPFLPIFARGLGVDLDAMTLALTARSLVGTLNPFVASFADRRGRKFGMLLAVLGILIFLGVMVMLPKDVRPAPQGPSMGSNFRTVLTFVPALAGLCVGMFTTTANEVVNLVFGVWLARSFGLKIAALGAAAAVIGISELCGEGLVAAFVDRLGKPRAVALGLGANSLAALLLPLIGRTEAGAVVGLFMFYITFEFTMVSSIPMMTEVLPSARATVMAFSVAFVSLGRVIGAPLATLLFHFGFPVVTAGAVFFNLLAYLALRRMQLALERNEGFFRKTVS